MLQTYHKMEQHMFALFILTLQIFNAYSIEIEGYPKFTVQPENSYYIPGSTFDGKLRCIAAGNPQPTITWFRNGKNAANANRVVVAGELMFLEFDPLKDEGEYRCKAFNSKGSVYSRKVNLTTAYIGKNFRIQSYSVFGKISGNIQIKCQPPNGAPPPSITGWYFKNTKVDLSSSKYRLIAKSDLLIYRLTHEDQGAYKCEAGNSYDTVLSRSIFLEVKRPPKFIEEPHTTSVALFSELSLRCLVDDSDEITWKKNGAVLRTSQKVSISSDGTLLKIKAVTKEDEGKYICIASNSVGTIFSQTAEVTTYKKPRFRFEPQRLTLSKGATAKFQCQLDTPESMIVWHTQSLGTVVYNGSSKKRIFVTVDGTLVVKNVSNDDEGTYQCSATYGSFVGSRSAHLEVKDVLGAPPIIALCPNDMRVMLNSDVVLPCYASTDNDNVVSSIVWHKDHHTIPFNELKRTSQTENGFLRIKMISWADAGNYTCNVMSPSFNRITCTAKVAVTDVKSEEIIPVPPMASSRPFAISVSSNFITLQWEASPSENAVSYEISYYKHDEGNWKWVKMKTPIIGNTHTIENLSPEQRYQFTVRAIGRKTVLGWASKISDLYTTKSLKSVNQPSISLLQSFRVPVEITGCIAHNITSLWVTWTIAENAYLISAYSISIEKLSKLSDNEDDYTVVKVNDPFTRSLFVSGLQQWNQYKFIVTPLYGFHSWTSSPSFICSTPITSPLRPPRDIHAVANSSSTVVVSWLPPPREYWGAPLRGYRIILFNPKDRSYIAQREVNNRTFSIVFVNLTSFTRVGVVMLAISEGGDGVLSDFFIVSLGETQSAMLKFLNRSWLLLFIGFAVWAFLLVFVIIMYIKYRSHKKTFARIVSSEMEAFTTIKPIQQDDSLRQSWQLNSTDQVYQTKKTAYTALNAGRDLSSPVLIESPCRKPPGCFPQPFFGYDMCYSNGSSQHSGSLYPLYAQGHNNNLEYCQSYHSKQNSPTVRSVSSGSSRPLASISMGKNSPLCNFQSQNQRTCISPTSTNGDYETCSFPETGDIRSCDIPLPSTDPWINGRHLLALEQQSSSSSNSPPNELFS